jgi:hypothetical protein
MLLEIDRWHREHKEASRELFEAGNIDPLPPERAFAERYQVDWPLTIDWTGWADYWFEDYPAYQMTDARAQANAEKLIDEAIRIVGRAVIVSNPDQTWMTTQPFEGILERLGAETLGYDLDAIESEEGPNLYTMTVRMVFDAPDEATADRIQQEIQNYTSNLIGNLANPPPWKDDVENFARAIPTSKLLKQEYINVLVQEWQSRYNLHNLPPASPYGQNMPAQRLALQQQTMPSREGLHFTWDGLWFHNQELGVSALIAWLEVNGCTNIDYYYVRLPPPEG